MGKIIKKHIKPDKDNLGSQVVISIKEDDILMAINQKSGISEIHLTYNQLCSLSNVIHAAIDKHYQEYSSCITQEKTQKIYIDDPVDW